MQKRRRYHRRVLGYHDPVSRRPENTHAPLLGMLLKLASVLFLAAMVACIKYVGERIPPGQIVFFRASVALLVILLLAWQRGEILTLLRTRHWRSHAARSLAGTFSMYCWFTALGMIPLAEMTVISFTVPLFLTLLAMVFLGERIRWYRWAALAIGFAGVIVIVGPPLAAAGGSPNGALIALTSAVSAAFALMFLRHMSGREHALTITFYFFTTAAACAALTALTGSWQTPSSVDWLLLLLTGVLGALGQLLMTYSYRYAEASLLAPLDYTNLLVAIAIGYYLFQEVPHIATWTGAPLVVAAGVIILWREYVNHRGPVADGEGEARRG
jgi:drug/metabolite transporter (DMT)-like permease